MIRDAISEIEHRANLQQGWETVADDVPHLVNALRAVLDEADKIDHPDHFENAEREEICTTCQKQNPWRGGAYWPCVYRKHAEAIRAVIANRLTRSGGPTA